MTVFDHIVPIKNCILELFVESEPLGEGASRTVYAVRDDATLVLKVERTGKTFHNMTEWLVWQEVKDWPIADWFAPCLKIDSWGTALLQRRTVPFASEREFRDALRQTRGGYLPSIFSDTHYDNFGMLNGIVVCHDYGYHKMIYNGAKALCEELGYLEYDAPATIIRTHRPNEEGQLSLDL